MGDYLGGTQTVQAWDVSNPAAPVLVRVIQTTNTFAWLKAGWKYGLEAAVMSTVKSRILLKKKW
jgi:hypothetical protein